jgi:hypothetical protein
MCSETDDTQFLYYTYAFAFIKRLFSTNVLQQDSYDDHPEAKEKSAFLWLVYGAHTPCHLPNIILRKHKFCSITVV